MYILCVQKAVKGTVRVIHPPAGGAPARTPGKPRQHLIEPVFLYVNTHHMLILNKKCIRITTF